MVKEVAKIAVCTFRTDMKTKKAEKITEKKFEEAETEEEIIKIAVESEVEANIIEGTEVQEL